MLNHYKKLAAILVMMSVILTGSLSRAAQERQNEPITSENAANVILLTAISGGRFITFDSRDGSRLISATGLEISDWHIQSSPKYVLVLDNTTQPPLTKDEHIETFAFSPSTNLVAFASVDNSTYDEQIRLLNLDTHKLSTLVQENVQLTGGMYEPVRQLEFSPDGNILARTAIFYIQLWDVATQKDLGYIGEKAPGVAYHSGDIFGIAFSPDGKWMASAGGNNQVYEVHDRSIWLWDAVTHKPITVLDGHTASVLRVVFSPDSSLLASSSDDRTIRLWSMETFKTIQVLDTLDLGTFADMTFSPDGSLLAASGLDGTIVLWDVQTGKQVTTLGTSSDSKQQIVSLSFSPDGTLLASGSLGDVIKLWGIPSVSENKQGE